MESVAGNFCKGVKIYPNSSEIIFGQRLYTFGDFLLVTVIKGHKQFIKLQKRLLPDVRASKLIGQKLSAAITCVQKRRIGLSVKFKNWVAGLGRGDGLQSDQIGRFWTFFLTNFVRKQITFLKIIIFKQKLLCLLFGQLLEKFGLLLFEHLVTLLVQVVVSVLVFYSDGPSSNPNEVYTLFLKYCLKTTIIIKVYF